ncbi:cation diffusion facilitator family transporter [Pseudoduganella buxea]|uniref:Cation diffusion facilitator family transporter n=1 Tax=Pseudoduganella buxea TaxID=1949069 RepID=A0A6I3SSX9_9BURK|nr:cation diffusion facilitator family transporter [Pseudoduganella buxea]MTV52270.1 cation diffusion facilitator family transporter [Pseudoduganella buxea]GGB86790.1 cation efflux protein [Pseudoduganella buxea]
MNAPSHLHAHLKGDAQYRHQRADRSLSILAGALGLTLLFAGVEVVAGFISNSLALISDAGHMVTDAASLGLALFAQLIAKRPPSSRYSFGFGRAEALAAFVNGIVMLLVVGWIVFEAVQRFAQPQAVAGGTVFIVAAIGLMVNLLVAWVLSKDRDSLNTRAALVHVLGDMLGSVAALIAGAVIYYTGWMQIDPLLSLLVSLLLLKSTYGILRESGHHLMEGVPEHIDYMALGEDLEALDGVVSVHDLHVWDMAPGEPALIGHVEVRDLQQWPHVLASIRAMLREKHRIEHVTLQAEVAGRQGRPDSAGH